MENSSLLGKHVNGECCLLFTDKKEAEILKYFENFSSKDFANSGTIANVDIRLPIGFEAFQFMS